MPTLKNDRRIFQRLDGIVNIRYAVKGRDEQMSESLPRNIGGGGAGICLPEQLQEGTIVQLEITIPDNPQKVISGAGEVLWTKPFGKIDLGHPVYLYETGISFIDIDPLAIGRAYTYHNNIQSRLQGLS